MIEDEWSPGSHAPFDPVAVKRAAELGTKVLYLNGMDLANAEKALDGERFVGTVIS